MFPRHTPGGAALLAVVLLASACTSDGGGEDAQRRAPSTTVATHEPESPRASAPAPIPGSLATVPSIPATSPVADDVVTTTTAPPFAPVDGAAPRGMIAPLQTPIDPPLDIDAEEPIVELGSLEIPTLRVVTPLYEGIRLTTFDRGAGHWPGTAMPGYVGNAVVGGHRTTASKPFRDIDQLVPGDQVIFNTVDGRFVYDVTGSEITDPEAIEIVRQTLGFTATLFACHPPGSTTERIVVHLTLAES